MFLRVWEISEHQLDNSTTCRKEPRGRTCRAYESTMNLIQMIIESHVGMMIMLVILSIMARNE